MKRHTEKCGCISEIGDRERWVSMCSQHEAEFQEIHLRWAQEHIARGGFIPRIIQKKESVSLDSEAPLTVGQLISTDTTTSTG